MIYNFLNYSNFSFMNEEDYKMLIDEYDNIKNNF